MKVTPQCTRYGATPRATDQGLGYVIVLAGNANTLVGTKRIGAAADKFCSSARTIDAHLRRPLEARADVVKIDSPDTTSAEQTLLLASRFKRVAVEQRQQGQTEPMSY